MRTFVVSLLIISGIAARANASVIKRLEKRGVTDAHGYSSGLVSRGSGLTFGTSNVQTDIKYLPPVSSLPVVKKHYFVPSIPVPVYNVTASAPHYRTVVPASVYGTPVPAPVPNRGVLSHLSVPIFKNTVPAPIYSASTLDSSISNLYNGLHLDYAGPASTSYGVPSTIVESTPHAQISFDSASFPSNTYGVPSSYASRSGISSGFSLSHLKSASVPSTSYGVPSTNVYSGPNDGYDYPVPSKKLLI